MRAQPRRTPRFPIRTSLPVPSILAKRFEFNHHSDLQRGKSHRIGALHARLHLDASPHEVIVSDGGSSDRTVELAAKCAAALVVFWGPAVRRLRRGEMTVPRPPVATSCRPRPAAQNNIVQPRRVVERISDDKTRGVHAFGQISGRPPLPLKTPICSAGCPKSEKP
jgi:hypothetical protein